MRGVRDPIWRLIHRRRPRRAICRDSGIYLVSLSLTNGLSLHGRYSFGSCVVDRRFNCFLAAYLLI